MTHVTIQKPIGMEIKPRLVAVHAFPVVGTFSVRIEGAFISVMSPEGHVSRLENVAVDLILDANELRTLSDSAYATLMRHAPEMPGAA